MKKIILPWKNAEAAARTLAARLESMSGACYNQALVEGKLYQPCVLLLGRGGLAAASLLSRIHPTLFNNPTVYLPYVAHRLPRNFQYRLAMSLARAYTHFFLIDDVYDSGATFRKARTDLRRINPRAYTFFAPLISKVKQAGLADATDGYLIGGFVVTNNWIRFPWEFEERSE